MNRLAPRTTTLGVVGGIAPGSTIDYYRRLVAAHHALRPDGGYPSIVIDSIDLVRLLRLAAERRHDELVDWLVDELGRLERAGASLGIVASNTPHIVFDELARRSPIPLVSIVEAAAENARARGWTRVGLVGTRFTMEGGFYPAIFDRYGISVHLPAPDDLSYVHERYVGELTQGEFRPATRQGIIQAIVRLRDRAQADGVILAGTELPLLLEGGTWTDVPLLDSTQAHVDKVARTLWS